MHPKRNQVWRRDVIEAEAARAIEEARGTADRKGLGAALARLDARLRKDPDGFQATLGRFAAARAGLILCSDHPEASCGLPPRPAAREAARYFREASLALEGAGIRHRGSRLSKLHGDLRAELRRAHAASEGEWRDHFRQELRALAPDTTHTTLIFLSEASMRDGMPADTLLRLLEAELGELPGWDAPAIHLARARVLRLSGRLREAELALAALREDAEWSAAVAWERSLLAAMQSGGLDEPFRFLRTHPKERTPDRLLLLWLWAYATRSKAWMREVPRVGTLAKQLTARGDDTRRLLRGIRAIERAYESSLPSSARAHEIGRALENLGDPPDFATHALFLAATSRWLLRAKKPEEAAVIGERYAALSLTVSEGATSDLFGLQLRADSVDAPITNGFARERSLARLAASLASVRVRRTLSPSDADLWTDYAETLAGHATVLKGPLMKIGQLLSFYGFALPEPATSLLRDLQDSAAPVPFETIRRVAEAELEGPLERTFARFDERPLGVGSIGQVHAARLFTGEDVVVKVQFPHIAECVQRDFRALRLLKPLLARTLPQWDLDGIFEELATRTLEECDYEREARLQQAFRERFAGDPCIVVPRVFTDLCRTRVLVSERFVGVPFRDFVATAGQRERDRAAESIVRFVLRTAINDSLFSTDMQPGNLLFSGDRVCFLDFGNVRHWPSRDGDAWRLIVSGLLLPDEAAFEKGLRAVGLISDRAADVSVIRRLILDHVMQAVTSDEPQTVRKETLAEEVKLLLRSGSAHGFRVPPSQVYAFRIYWGMCAILADLRASFPARALTIEVLGLSAAGTERASHAAGP